MAIDTRNKRGSALGFLQPSFQVFPNPDGDISIAPDRAQMCRLYFLEEREVTPVSWISILSVSGAAASAAASGTAPVATVTARRPCS